MNILFLMAGEDRSGGRDNDYPVYLQEFGKKTLIQKHIDRVNCFSKRKSIFALREEVAKRFYLDKVISLLEPEAKIVRVQDKTQGSVCTALMGIQHIGSDEELLIISTDELLDYDYKKIIEFFKKENFDAGTVVFNSIHPRYSFVRLEKETSLVVEAAEKRPISKNATAGFYYFKRGQDFIEAAKAMIKKDATTDGKFYVCPVFNEMILDHKKIGVYSVDDRCYVPLKSEDNINKYKNIINEMVP